MLLIVATHRQAATLNRERFGRGRRVVAVVVVGRRRNDRHFIDCGIGERRRFAFVLHIATRAILGQNRRGARRVERVVDRVAADQRLGARFVRHDLQRRILGGGYDSGGSDGGGGVGGVGTSDSGARRCSVNRLVAVGRARRRLRIATGETREEVSKLLVVGGSIGRLAAAGGERRRQRNLRIDSGSLETRSVKLKGFQLSKFLAAAAPKTSARALTS